MESLAHFVKFSPHFSVMQSRKVLSHAFDVVIPDGELLPFVVVFVFCASSSARCRRIVSASSFVEVSDADAPVSDRTALNFDVLLLTAIGVDVVAAFATPYIAMMAAKIESL